MYSLLRCGGCDTEQNHRLSMGRLRNQQKSTTHVPNVAPKHGNKKVAALIRTIIPIQADTQSIRNALLHGRKVAQAILYARGFRNFVASPPRHRFP